MNAWTIERLAAYLQALVDTGFGECEVFVQGIDSNADDGMLGRVKFHRIEDAGEGDPIGTLHLEYGHLGE